jgi:hypothetical protein
MHLELMLPSARERERTGKGKKWEVSTSHVSAGTETFSASHFLPACRLSFRNQAEEQSLEAKRDLPCDDELPVKQKNFSKN